MDIRVIGIEQAAQQRRALRLSINTAVSLPWLTSRSMAVKRLPTGLSYRRGSGVLPQSAERSVDPERGRPEMKWMPCCMARGVPDPRRKAQ